MADSPFAEELLRSQTSDAKSGLVTGVHCKHRLQSLWPHAPEGGVQSLETEPPKGILSELFAPEKLPTQSSLGKVLWMDASYSKELQNSLQHNIKLPVPVVLWSRSESTRAQVQ